MKARLKCTTLYIDIDVSKQIQVFFKKNFFLTIEMRPNVSQTDFDYQIGQSFKKQCSHSVQIFI